MTKVIKKLKDKVIDSSNIVYENKRLNKVIKSLKQENEKANNIIYNALPTINAKGSNITLNGTSNSVFKDFKICGDCYQETTNGYNLLDNQLENQTIDGITLIVNSDKSIKLTGTAAKRVEPVLQSNFTLPAGTYYNYTGTAIIFSTPKGYYTFNNRGSLTFENDIAVLRAYFRVENGTTINTTIYPMLTENANAMAYEPYTGGEPSPNPDYPQEIQVVTGENKITLSNGTEDEKYPLSLGDLELCSIGDYKDYIYYKNGEWWKSKNIKSENFKNIEKYDLDTNVLATPVEEEITDPTLVSQLNTLYNAKTYQGQTNIVVTAEDGNLPAILDVTAFKKID